MWPCGIVTLISELFLAESKAQVYGHLHQFLQSVPTTASNLSKLVFVLQKQQMTAISSRQLCNFIIHLILLGLQILFGCHLEYLFGMLQGMCSIIFIAYPEFICYDDGCHLQKYARNSSRSDLTPTTTILSQVETVVDKMHFARHMDSWCKTTCDPHLFSDLRKVHAHMHFSRALYVAFNGASYKMLGLGKKIDMN